MKSLFLFISLFLWTALTLQGQEALKPKEEAAIRAVLATQQDAWNRADVPAFMEGYWKSDSLTFLGGDGPKYGWQTTLDNYYVRYPDKAAMGQLRFDVLRLEKLGSRSAFMMGRWYLTRSIGDVGGYFTLIWKKIEGNWVIVSDHTS